ncbi:DNA-binding protein [Haloarcula laminariae]|uniref:DNA-binding protein n=1 Tax=Haloarcula laminariae TaxID=2961577 RepID=UPI0021C60E6A|nr:DNA-binding protein [Halomicroarcula laminariae]
MPQIETAIPESESSASVCEYCGHPFPTHDRLVLHRGVEHPGQLDAAEEEAFTEAYAVENDELETFRLKALVVLVLLYFAFIMLYAIFA